MNWESLLAKLKASVGPGKITTYRELAMWAFNKPFGTQAVVAMLKAAVRDNSRNAIYTNRVVPENGILADVNGQSAQLIAEGILVQDGKVALHKTCVVRFR